MLVRCGLAGKTLRFDGADEVLQILRAVTQGWSLCEIPEPQGDHEIGIRRDGDVYSIEEIGHQMLREPSAVSAACSLVAILLNRLVENDPSLLALHAGAVAIGARTIIFPATHRAGKSTMAAALALRGHRLVAEDILPLDCGSAAMAAVASGTAPRLRLPLPPSSALRFRVSAWLRAGPDDGRAHEISQAVAPHPTQTAAPGGLAVGDQPMPLADMLAASQPRQQVGVGRACLLGPLDRRDQKSTAAAPAERTASAGMKR